MFAIQGNVVNYAISYIITSIHECNLKHVIAIKRLLLIIIIGISLIPHALLRALLLPLSFLMVFLVMYIAHN